MTAVSAFAALKTALLAVHGRAATLVGNGTRDDVTVCLMPNWEGATMAGLPVDRVEPVAYLATTDAVSYDVTNGKTLEVADDFQSGVTTTYRIVASAKDDMGLTKLTLAKT